LRISVSILASIRGNLNQMALVIEAESKWEVLKVCRIAKQTIGVEIYAIT
jgi:hypothetical protein